MNYRGAAAHNNIMAAILFLVRFICNGDDVTAPELELAVLLGDEIVQRLTNPNILYLDGHLIHGGKLNFAINNKGKNYVIPDFFFFPHHCYIKSVILHYQKYPKSHRNLLRNLENLATNYCTYYNIRKNTINDYIYNIDIPFLNLLYIFFLN